MRRPVLVAIALVIAAAAAAAFHVHARSVLLDASEALTTLYRATCDLKAGAQLVRECVEPVTVTEAAAQASELRRFLHGERIQIARVASLVRDLKAGELLRCDHFDPARRPIPEGHVLVTTRVDPVRTGAGVVPGAVVDLHRTDRSDPNRRGKLVLERLRVEEVDGYTWVDQEVERQVARLSFVVPRAEAATLTSDADVFVPVLRRRAEDTGSRPRKER